MLNTQEKKKETKNKWKKEKGNEKKNKNKKKANLWKCVHQSSELLCGYD